MAVFGELLAYHMEEAYGLVATVLDGRFGEPVSGWIEGMRRRGFDCGY